MYYLLIGGALSAAFIPVFTSYLANNKEKEGWYVASTFINVTVLLLFAFTILGIIFAPRLAPLVAYNFTGEICSCWSGRCASCFLPSFSQLLQACRWGSSTLIRSSVPPAFRVIVYNLAIIAACYLLGHL